MARRQWWIVGTITARLIIFALLALIGPAYVAGLLQDVLNAWQVKLGYWLLLLACAMVMGTLLAWSAYRWKGLRLEEEARVWDTGRASSRGEWELRRRGLELAFLLDVFHWPFIQLFAAVEDLKKLQVAAKAEPGAVRSVLIALLCSRTGMEIEALLPEGRKSAVGVYLDLHDWAGYSQDGKKVWLLSEARKRVEEAS